MSRLVAAADEIFAANRAFGRIALTATATAGRTRRERVREEGPLRVRWPGPPSPELHAVIINTAAGVAGGDCLSVDISVASGARLVVTTAAAEKVYRSLGPDATIKLSLRVGAGACLFWLPQETILFDGARLVRRVNVELEDDARLVFAEAVVFGRSGMGETVCAGRVSDRWQLCRRGKLVHVELVQLDGAIAAKLSKPAVAGCGRAMATVLMVPGDEAMAGRVRALGNRFRGEVGASTWKGMTAVRLCARDGAAARHDLTAILNSLGSVRLPRLWTS
jgi:urease accessory protein